MSTPHFSKLKSVQYEQQFLRSFPILFVTLVFGRKMNFKAIFFAFFTHIFHVNASYRLITKRRLKTTRFRSKSLKIVAWWGQALKHFSTRCSMRNGFARLFYFDGWLVLRIIMHFWCAATSSFSSLQQLWRQRGFLNKESRSDEGANRCFFSTFFVLWTHAKIFLRATRFVLFQFGYLLKGYKVNIMHHQ